MNAAMYLRKSRAEDGMDTTEILRRHRETLTEYAAREGIHVMEVLQEIKSGESLYSRPQMLQLLADVEAGKYGCVLCMDIDRLSRGDTLERGMVWEAFKVSGTLIVTPGKVYDLSEESDELMTELRGLFANYELRKIKERTRRGIICAAKEGQHLTPAPYGYKKCIKNGKHTLEIYEPEAHFVRMAFELYGSGLGCGTIATRLTDGGARPHYAPEFTRAAIGNILKNPVYIGRVVYNQTRWVRKKTGMGHDPRPESEWIVVDEAHPPIVSAELFEKCQQIRKTRWRPVYFDGSIKNPLAGIMRCKRCGGRMNKRCNGGHYYLRCDRGRCSTLANYGAVEQAVIEGLRDILSGLETEAGEQSADALKAAQERLLSTQAAIQSEKRKRERLYDFLESGTYTETVFAERMNAVNTHLAALESREQTILQEIETLSRQNEKRQAAGICTLLDEYYDADAPGKNALLRSVVDVIFYERNSRDEPFTLEIFLK